MPTMPTRLAITASRSFVADQQTPIAHPRQERSFRCDRGGDGIDALVLANQEGLKLERSERRPPATHQREFAD
jgi:hypothetical protein